MSLHTSENECQHIFFVRVIFRKALNPNFFFGPSRLERFFWNAAFRMRTKAEQNLQVSLKTAL